HGPKGLTHIASRVHGYARFLERELAERGVRQLNDLYFDTLRFMPAGGAADIDRIKASATKLRLNFRDRGDGTINVALDETTDAHDVAAILLAFTNPASEIQGTQNPSTENPRTPNPEPRTPNAVAFPSHLSRTSPFLTHPVFNTHH